MSDAIYIFLVYFSNCSFPLLLNAPSSSSSRLLTISSRLITRYQLRSAIGRNISLGMESNEPSVFFTAFPVLPVQNFRTIVLNYSSICSQLNSLLGRCTRRRRKIKRDFGGGEAPRGGATNFAAGGLSRCDSRPGRCSRCCGPD